LCLTVCYVVPSGIGIPSFNNEFLNISFFILATTSATDHQLNDQFSLQAAVFMNFFFALKGMVNAPVESSTEDCFGFHILQSVIIISYYILPSLTSITMWAAMEVCFRFVI
jgi:hypothetical protein